MSTPVFSLTMCVIGLGLALEGALMLFWSKSDVTLTRADPAVLADRNGQLVDSVLVRDAATQLWGKDATGVLVPLATDPTKLQTTNGPAPIKGTVVWTDKP